MHRAFIRNFEQLGSLFGRELANKMNVQLDAIEHASLASQSAQSDACTLECHRLTVTSWSGHPFRRAYIPTVIEVQAPKAANRSS